MSDDATGLPLEPAVRPEGGLAFWIGAVAGWVIIVLGVRMGLHDRELKPWLLVKWVAATLVLHDAVWLGVVAVIGAVAAVAFRHRRVPIVLAWAAATSAVLIAIGWPFVRGYGRRPDVPSALQRNYARGVLAYIAIVWVAAACALVIGHRRQVESNEGESK
jgi:hypothetical protein